MPGRGRLPSQKCREVERIDYYKLMQFLPLVSTGEKNCSVLLLSYLHITPVFG